MIEWRQYLISDPQICHGQLCAQGTRVWPRTFSTAWQKGQAGRTSCRVTPSLASEHIDAAIAYAAERAHEEGLLPLRST